MAIQSLAEANNDVRVSSSDVSAASNAFATSGCDLKDVHITQGNQSVLKVSATQTANMTSDLSQEMDTKVAQAAETIRLNLDLNPGSGHATNILNLTEQVASEVNNTARTSCAADSSDFNSVACTNSNWDHVYIDQRNYRDKTLVCVQDAMIQNELASKLSTAVDQSAKTETQDALSRVLLLVLLIMVAYVVIRYTAKGGGKSGSGVAGGRKETSSIFIQLIIISVASALVSLHVTYNCKRKARGLVPGVLPGLHFLRWCRRPDLEVRAQGIVASSFFAGMGITLLEFMDRSSSKTAVQGVTVGSWLASVTYWSQPEDRRREWRVRILAGVAVLVVAGVGYAVMNRAPGVPPAPSASAASVASPVAPAAA